MCENGCLNCKKCYTTWTGVITWESPSVKWYGMLAIQIATILKNQSEAANLKAQVCLLPLIVLTETVWQVSLRVNGSEGAPGSSDVGQQPIWDSEASPLELIVMSEIRE